MAETDDLIADALASGANRVTKLDLRSRQLSVLPESIGQLTNLGTLYLDDNRLSTLPDSIGQLTNLRYLYLSGNQLTVLPDSIGQFTNLGTLYLDDNQLTVLPDTIDQLTNLKILSLNGNQLTVLPDSIGQLTNLTTLHLMSNQLTVLPDSIGQLTNLRYLYFNGNQLTALPDSIGQLTNLGDRSTGDLLGSQRPKRLPEPRGEVGPDDLGDVAPEAGLFPRGASVAQVSATLHPTPYDETSKVGLLRALEPLYMRTQQLRDTGAFDDDEGILERVEDALRGLRVQLWPKDGENLKSPNRAIDFARELASFQLDDERKGLDTGDPGHDDLDLAEQLLAKVSFNGSDADVRTATELAQDMADALDWKGSLRPLVDLDSFTSWAKRTFDASELSARGVEAMVRFGDAKDGITALYADAEDRWLRFGIWADSRSAEALASMLGWIDKPHPNARLVADILPRVGAGAALGGTAGELLFSHTAVGGFLGAVAGLIVAVLGYGFTTNE